MTLMRVSMMRFFLLPTNEPTDKARYMYDVCMYVWCRNVWCLLVCLHDACTYDACAHDACTMHIAMIYLDPDACFLCNRPTDKSTMNDACMYLQVCELCMYDACIYHLRPLTLVHVCFMCICMMHAQYIYEPGPWSWCMHVGVMHVSMMRLKFCHGRTNQRTRRF